jgi:hypothetical protein
MKPAGVRVVSLVFLFLQIIDHFDIPYCSFLLIRRARISSTAPDSNRTPEMISKKPNMCWNPIFSSKNKDTPTSAKNGCSQNHKQTSSHTLLPQFYSH